MLVFNGKYDALITKIGQVLTDGQHRSVVAINDILIRTYWLIGKEIIEYEQLRNQQGGLGTDLFEKAFPTRSHFSAFIFLPASREPPNFLRMQRGGQPRASGQHAADSGRTSGVKKRAGFQECRALHRHHLLRRHGR